MKNMKIIEIKALENGAHRNQSSSNLKTAPDGWAIIPDDMELPQTFPFVNITVDENGNIIIIEANQEAYDAAKASEEEIESTPSIQDDIDTMLIDHEYRLTMLELFSEISV
jgi:hypothetical protein